MCLTSPTSLRYIHSPPGPHAWLMQVKPPRRRSLVPGRCRCFSPPSHSILPRIKWLLKATFKTLREPYESYQVFDGMVDVQRPTRHVSSAATVRTVKEFYACTLTSLGSSTAKTRGGVPTESQDIGTVLFLFRFLKQTVATPRCLSRNYT